MSVDGLSVFFKPVMDYLLAPGAHLFLISVRMDTGTANPTLLLIFFSLVFLGGYSHFSVFSLQCESAVTPPCVFTCLQDWMK